MIRSFLASVFITALALLAGVGAAWGQSFAPTTVDAAEETGRYNSQAIVNGNPAIAYSYGYLPGKLRFARNSAADGSGAWTITILESTGGVGLFISLAIVNGNPAISYVDIADRHLKYVRANDVNGASWGAPVTVDGSSYVDSGISLSVIDGSPAIGYCDKNTFLLKYVRASNVNGTNWGTPVNPDGVSLSYSHVSLAFINGSPAISYGDLMHDDLRYVRASDASGTNWGTPVIVDNISGGGSFTSLVIVTGNPAISYCRFTHDFPQPPTSDLNYVRASDTNGANWGTPVRVDGATADVGRFTSLAIIDGNPAISYYDDTNTYLKYVRASDASGAGWGTPVIIEGSDGYAVISSLAFVNGNPAISYSDYYGVLKWATVGLSPDLVVTQASALSDGVSSVDFGMVNPGYSSAALTFTITNTGTADLTSLALNEDGNVGDFEVSSLGSTWVAAGNSITFTVYFTPRASGPRSAGLHLTNNVSGSKNPFDFTVTGTGNTAPTLSLPGSPLVVVATSASGAVVTFSATANDAEDGALTPAVMPASGSTFAVGDTTVNVAATDSGGATTNGSFVVRVQTPLQDWKLTNLGDANAPDLGDPDGDGLLTLAEYGLVLPPGTTSLPPGASRFTYAEGERLRLTLSRDPARNDVTIEVLAADSVSGPWTSVATSTLGAPFTGTGYVGGDAATPGVKTVEVRDVVNLADAPQRFLRVRVSR